MGHEDREFGFCQDMTRYTPEDHLPQAAVGIGTLHQEIGT
jgi:hypothetical protein